MESGSRINHFASTMLSMALYYSLPDLRRSRSPRFGLGLGASKISDDKITNIMLFWYGIHKQCSKPGIQCFFIPESGMKKILIRDPKSRIRDKHLGSYFRELRTNFLGSKYLNSLSIYCYRYGSGTKMIRDGKFKIRDL
jgi:hypothetical protein